MISFLDFALIGLATGAIFSLIAQGAVLVYRGSGLLSLAQGAFAMTGAYLYYSLHVQAAVPAVPSLIISVCGCALGGSALHMCILRSMRRSSSLARVVVILAVVVVLQSAAYLIYGQYPKTTTSLISTRTVFLLSSDRLPIGIDSLVIIGIALAVTLALTLLYRFTSTGRLTAAVAESDVVVSSLGHSPDLIAALNWGLGSALAGFAGILIAPSISLEPTGLVLLVIPALAAALVGHFRSFPVTLAMAVAIGVAESEITKYVSTPGWPDAAPLLVVIAILSLRGDGLPLRSFVLDRLPRVGTGRVYVAPAIICFALVLLWIFRSGPDWSAAISTTVSFGIVCLSVVVITGYAGQLSLGQYALAGLSALIGAKLALHMPFLAAVVLAVAVTAAIGGVLGLPALRTRGATLAIVTLGLGNAIVDVFLLNGNYTGGPGGITPPVPHMFGLSLDPFRYPHRYAVFVLAVGSLCLLATLNLRRGVIGRRLLAVRSNERGAAALGINVASAKLYAFTLSSALAGLGGVLLTFSQPTLTFSGFTVFTSIYIVAATVTAGVGYVTGAPLGSLLIAGGVMSQLFNGFSTINLYLPLIGGVAVIVTLRSAPDGQVAVFGHQLERLTRPYLRLADRVSRRFGKGGGEPTLADGFAEITGRQSVGGALLVEDLTVRFGVVRAVDGVSIEVKPGEIHGLIGPNGSGKTTLIDAITGFVGSEGRVSLGQRSLAGLSAKRRANEGLSRSFQSLELFNDLSVEENLAVAAEAPAPWRYLTDLLRPGRVRLSASAVAAMLQFDLGKCRGALPEQISFGQRKAVAIARAVAGRPAVLLLDEPAAGLDDVAATELADFVRRIAHDLGIGVLLVEHKVDMVTSISDRITVLQEGRVLASGDPLSVMADERVVAAYLGPGIDQPIGVDPDALELR